MHSDRKWFYYPDTWPRENFRCLVSNNDEMYWAGGVFVHKYGFSEFMDFWFLKWMVDLSSVGHV